MSEKILEVRQLATSFHTARGWQQAIDGVSFDVYQGEILGIVGESGCGKSVTAQTIMNQLQAAGIPTVWFNRPVSTNNEEAANLFLNHPASAFVGTNFEDAGVMQGELIGQYLVEHYNDIDLNGDGKISYIMFKGDEANQEAIARTALAVEYANKALVAAGKPEIEFYDASNANKYLVDPNGSWSNVFSSEQMQTVLSMYNEGNGNKVELVICNNDDMAYGAVMALQNAG